VNRSCFGQADASVEYRIVTDTGAEAASGEPGELRVRHAGPRPRFGFFAGYLKDDAATAAAWEGGWFHTGDLVIRDAQNYLHFVDRKKNVIRRSGENISALEVEGIVARHAEVQAVGVTSVTDPLRGEEVFACIIPRGAAAGSIELAHNIVALCLKQMAYFKAPGYIAFCDSLPLTATEKIQRSGLRDKARQLHSTDRCIDLRALKRRDAT
jgi:acyl-coenzyme A synthetase/AMP-(fatty) acid ligase